MTKRSKKELLEMNHEELLERHWELQELFFAPKKNSKNSSKPPSSDNDSSGVKKNQSLREKSDKKSGGQTGHKGSTKGHQTPSEIVTHRKDNCSKCKRDISSNERNTIETRQEIDIPPIVPYVTQHERQETICTCGCKIRGEFPLSIKGHTQRGPNIASLVTYLNVRHKIPYKRLSEIMSETLGVNIGEGSIDNILRKMGMKSEEKCKEIMEGLKKSEYVGSDETGNHVNGEKWRVRARQSKWYAYLCIDKSRGYQVVKAHFGEDFQGILGHDCWSAHNNTQAGGHQLCLAHLQRDLNYVFEKDRTKWSYDLRSLILNAQTVKKKWMNGELIGEKWEQVKSYYHDELERLCERVEGRPKDTMRLWKRIKKHKEKIRTFLENELVPAHNNASEQLIRNQKIHKKVSGGFRSEEGGQRHCHILSVIETSRRHGLEVLDSLKLLYAGNLLRVRPE